MKLKFILNSLILAIIVGMTIVPAMSTAVPGNYAIQLENDQSVIEASMVLQRNVPKINIIEYGSFKYNLIAHRTISPIVWIGHGDENGIVTKKEIISWEQFSEEIKITPASDIVLACYSSNLLKQTTLTQAEVFTFNGEVDSTFGALLAAYLLTHNEKVYKAIINHLISLINQKVEYNPLALVIDDPGGGGGTPAPTTPTMNIPATYQQATTSYSYAFAKLSGVELGYHILMLVILFFDLAVGYACAKAGMKFIQSAVIEFWLCGKISLIVAIAYYAAGLMTQDEFVEEVFGSFNDAFGCFVKIWNAMSLGEKIGLVAILVGAGAILTLELLLDIFFGGAGTGIRTAVSIALVVLYVYNLFMDCTDSDTIVG